MCIRDRVNTSVTTSIFLTLFTILIRTKLGSLNASTGNNNCRMQSIYQNEQSVPLQATLYHHTSYHKKCWRFTNQFHTIVIFYFLWLTDVQLSLMKTQKYPTFCMFHFTTAPQQMLYHTASQSTSDASIRLCPFQYDIYKILRYQYPYNIL